MASANQLICDSPALKGGDWMARLPSPISSVEEKVLSLKLPISPLEGEMAGRPEGGAWAPSFPMTTHLETFQ
ncbi:hypothetical protein EOA16_25160 [Mesorhizobium sp. M7A.F.Ca.US.008.03.1.1]|nr:hypothetical protein EOA16_25160 [Mesorhizobium sp. M7A.F.Ca.US.008.03.1.1]